MSAPDRYAPSMYSDLCYVGPLGRLEALPDVAATGGTQVSVTRIGGMHRSLGGGMTIDTFARKRTWTWTYDMLLDKQLAYVEALQWGNVRGPLRLIDPRRYNRLPEEIASCGTTTASSRKFITDNDSVAYWRPAYVFPGDLSTLGPRLLVTGGLEWQILTPSAENFVLAADRRYTDGVWRVPVLPNETLEISAWALFPANTSAVVGASWRTAEGVFVTSDATEYTAGGGDEWIKLSVTASAPDGAEFCAPFLVTEKGYVAPGTSIYTTAWQIASPTLARLMPPGVTEHCDIPERGGEWRQGGGAPFVIPETGGNVYARPGFYNTALTLYEN